MGLKVGELFATLGLDSGGFSKGLDGAEKSMKSAAKNMSSAGLKLTLGLTVPLVALGKSVFGAAMEWESAFAGVRKTIDGTEADFAALEQGIIDMSKELPASAVEIAGVAEAAGQLGVAKDNILAFTQVMIDLGETTNLSADDAATMLAQFANVTQMVEKYGADAYSRLGSVVVALGNDGASTEAQIVSMGQRIAGAATQVGFTDAQIMGLSSALASVGVEAEAGGSSMSTFLSEMNLAVSNGGKDLKKFAKVAGVSTDEFSKLFKDDAAGALELFVKGLGSAEDPLKTLTDMGIDEIRMRDALLRLAGAGDLLSDSFDTANRAWDENTALSDEAAQRYKTMESVLALVKNNVTELARQLGDALAPYVMEAAKWVRKLTTFLQGLSPEVKEGAVKIGLLAAAIGPGMLAMSKLMKLMGGGAGFAKVFKLALSPVGLLAGGLFALYKLSPKVRAAFGKMTKFGKTFFKALSNGTSLTDSLGYSIAKVFGGKAYKSYKTVMDKIGVAWSKTVSWLKTTGDGFSKAWASGSKNGGLFGAVGESVSYLYNEVKTLASGINWSGLWSALWTKLTDVGKWIKDEGALNVGVLVGKFSKWLGNSVSALGAWIGDYFSDTAENGGGADGGNSQTWYEMGADWITDLMANFMLGVYNGYTGESLTLEQFMPMIEPLINGLIDTMFDTGKKMIGMLAAGMMSGFVGMLSDFESAQWFADTMNDMLEALGFGRPLEKPDPSNAPFSGLAEAYYKSYQEELGTLKGKDFKTPAEEARIAELEKILDAMIYKGDELPVIPQDKSKKEEKPLELPAMVDVPRDIKKTIVPEMEEVPRDIKKTIVPAMEEVPKDIVKLTPQMNAAGSGMVQALGAAISGGGNSLFTAADDMAAAALGGLEKMNETYQTGMMFSKGFANGITSGTAWIVAAAIKAALAAKRAMNTALGIASPSKVAFASGAFFSEGFADGISSLRSSVARASTAIAGAASKGLGYVPVSRRAPTMARSASGGASVDMNRLAAIIAARPAVLRINDKVIARATVDANMSAQAERDARLSAGYGV